MLVYCHTNRSEQQCDEFANHDSSADEFLFGVNTPEVDPDLSDAEDVIILEDEDLEIDQWGPSQALMLWEDLGKPVVITLKVNFFSWLLFQVSSTLGEIFLCHCRFIAWGGC